MSPRRSLSSARAPYRVPCGCMRFLVLLATFLGWFAATEAISQPSAHLHRVGLLFIGSPSAADPTASGFRRGMRDLGYVEGRNIAFEFRDAAGCPERLVPLAAEHVQAKVDVIVA